MYNHKLINESNVFELDMDIPVNTTTTASTAVRAAGAQGLLAVTVLANDSSVALASGSVLTIGILTSATEGGSFTAPAQAPSVALTLAAGVALAPAAGDKIASLIVPGNTLDVDDDAWVKATIATDDAAAAGDIDVFLEYLAT